MRLQNLYTFERWEKRDDLWTPTAKTRSLNIVPTEGLNADQVQIWTTSAVSRVLYVGIIPQMSFTTVALTDTAAQINGSNAWIEFAGYSETVRQTLTMGAPATGALDNSAAQAIFTVVTAFTLQGGFVVSSNVKGGTSGVLLGATSAPSPIPYTIGQQVRITVSSTLSN